MINQNLKILHTASFFLTCTDSALLIILQSLVAPYQKSTFKMNALLIILQSLLAPTSSYFYNIVMACLTFYWKGRANTHTYPIFLFCLFCFMVQSSRAIDKEWGSNNDHLSPLTMAVTIYFKGLLWQDFVQFLCQTKRI